MWENIADTLVAIQASFLIVLQNWPVFLHLLSLQFAFAVLISNILAEIIFDKNLLTVLSFLGGILGATLFSLCLVVVKIKQSPVLGMAVFCISLALIIWNRKQLTFSATILKITIFFLFILLLRLIFIQNLLVPPYADSVTHLQIVLDFMSPERPPQATFYLSFDLKHYYHFGFHALAAWLSGVTTTDPIQAILILGQYFQALAVLAIYPLTHILSRNSLSAWTTMCISGLFLPIPSYASNWGKYPAIASMIGIAFVITIFLIRLKFKSFAPARFWWLIGLAVLSSICLHSRSILALMAIVVTYHLCIRINPLRKKQSAGEQDFDAERTRATIFVIFAMVIILLIWKLGMPFWMFLVFILLFALAFYSDFFAAEFLSILVIIMGLGYFVPIQWFPLSARFEAIFDRHFLIIFFFLPASILVWLGLEGGLSIFIDSNRISLRRWLLAVTVILGIINAVSIQNHRPSECCVFLNDDDLFAFAWMQKNIPDNAIVGIAATGEPGKFLPADGGAWIKFFTNIQTRKVNSSTDFFYEVENLCKEGVTYVYLDNLENSFDEYGLVEINSDYRFVLGDVRIYQLPCDGILTNRKFP